MGSSGAVFPIPPAFLVCLPSVALGNVRLKDQVVRGQREVKDGAFSALRFGGILGSEFLRQFEVTFDLAHNRTFLKNDPHFKRDPMGTPPSGFNLLKTIRGNMP
jgi:hypothetical protein